MNKRTKIGELARQYAKEKIKKELYRKKRSELLLDIINQNTTVEDIDYDPPIKNSEVNNELYETAEQLTQFGQNIDLDPTAEPSPPPPKTEQSTSAPNFSLISWSIGGIAVLVLIIIIASSLFISDTDDKSEYKVAQQLIGNFLIQKDWTNSSIDNFTKQWSKYSDQTKQQTLDSNRMKRLNNAIYEQLTNAQILSSKSETHYQKQHLLVDFAKDIGIEDNRLVVVPKESEDQ